MTAFVTDANFEAEVIKSSEPVLVDFFAEWCGPCKAMAPAFAEAARMRPQVHFVKVDTEASQDAAIRYGIRSIPTMVSFVKGAERARVSGAMPTQRIVAWVDGATDQ